jgi:membrane protein implicated in regulation of membrane protease activity
LASFVTAFGAFGMIFHEIEATKSMWVSAPLSGVSAAVIAGLVFWLFNIMFQKTQSSSESHIAQVVGMVASIITPIPANGVGEIAYVQSGSRYTAPARSEGGVAISCAQTVRVTRIVGSQFFVEPAPETQSANKNLNS